jgi:glycosyltransferase 2 family protein
LIINWYRLNSPWFKRAIKLSFLALAVVILVRLGALNRSLLAGIHLTFSGVLISLLCVVGVALMQSWRWLTILSGAHIQTSFGKLCRIVFIGFFYNMIFPGSTGYDGTMVCYAASEHDGARTLACCSVVLDRFFGVITLLAISLCSLSYLSVLGKAPLALKRVIPAIVIFFFIGIVLIAALGKILKQDRLSSLNIRGFYIKDLLRLWPEKYKLVMIIAISLLSHGLIFANMINCAYILGFDNVSLPIWLAIIPPALLVNQVPLTPGGLGFGEFSLFVFLSFFQVNQNTNPGALIFLLFRLTLYLLAFPGAILMLSEPSKEPKKNPLNTP